MILGQREEGRDGNDQLPRPPEKQLGSTFQKEKGEWFCVEVLTTENKRKIPEKLRARIASMTKKEIDSELLLRQIWDKVQQNLA